MKKNTKKKTGEFMAVSKPAIEHAQSAGASPAWLLLVEGFNEISQDGFSTRKIMIRPEDQVLYIRSGDGDIVAALSYRIDSNNRALLVSLVYVEPSSRRLGLFKALWHELSIRAKNADCDHIQAEVHAADAVTLAIFANKATATAQAIRFTRTTGK